MKLYLLIIIVGFASCMNNELRQHLAVFDEPSLKSFVLSTKSKSQSETMHELDSILKGATTDSLVFRQTIHFLEAPFASPNSSYRNQDLYIEILQAKTRSQWLINEEKKITEDRIGLLQQNNVGTAANDFTYITPAGYERRMYDIKARYLLLYFNNPECPACKEMKTTLMNSAVIMNKIQSDALKVLSIYTDKEEKLWLDHLNEYPDSWIQGRDDNEYLYQHKVYDLRAIPTIYLLDSDKKVLLKDCTDISDIEKQLVQ